MVMARKTYLHVGAPKTGSTFLQRIAWANRELLGSRGVFMPGRAPVDHFRAGYDLRGFTTDPDNARVTVEGAWNTMAATILDRAEEIALVSDERLAACTEAEVERAVASLAPDEVHVVYVTRDPAGLLSAEWQEHVKHGDQRAFDAWLDDTLNPKGHEWYWKVHGVGDVLRRWGSVVPSERLHLLTLPPRGSDPELLWRRFCSLLGISPEGVDTDVRANVSLGVEGAELLRQVNEALPVEFPRWHHIGVTRNVLAHRILAERAEKTPIVVPERLAAQVEDYTERLVAEITDSGCDVVGGLDELATPVGGDGIPEAPDVTAAAIDAISGLLVHIGGLRDDLRDSRGQLRTARRELAEEVRRGKAEAPITVRTRQLLHEHRDLPPAERMKRCVVELRDRSRVLRGMLTRYRTLRRYSGSVRGR